MESKLLLQMTAVVAGGRVLYLSVPLTTGERELRVQAELGVELAQLRQPPYREQWKELVFEANRREAWVYAELARSRFIRSVVVDPSSLDKPAWGQDTYNLFWSDLITEYVSAVIAAPGWAFSRGARLELDLALRLRLPILTVDGAPLGPGDIAAADLAAGQALGARHGADAYLAPMPSLRDVEPAAAAPDSFALRGTAEVVGWLLGERSYQLKKFGIAQDDRNTAKGFGDDSWWFRQLTMYLDRGARRLGVENPLGRQALGKFAATACGLGESVLRCYGPWWSDSPLSTDGAGPVRQGREADALFRWVVSQRSSGLGAEEIARDDAWIASDIDEGNPWWHETMRNLRGAQRFELHSWEGRQAVGQIVLSATGLVEAVRRRYGPLPPPGVPSGYQLGSRSPS